MRDKRTPKDVCGEADCYLDSYITCSRQSDFNFLASVVNSQLEFLTSCGVVTKISSCQVNTTSRRRIKQLGISFGSIFLLFCDERSRGPRSQQPGEIPGPCLLMTALLMGDNANYRFTSNCVIPIKSVFYTVKKCTVAWYTNMGSS